MQAKISLIIPIYNTQKFIKRALESVINQSFKDIEIICVDDCGGDKSMDIVKEFAKKDSRIKIIKNPKNLGLFATRFRGVLAATSEFVMFLDSDDFLDLKACELVYKNFKEGGGATCYALIFGRRSKASGF